MTFSALSLESDDFLVGTSSCDTVAPGAKCRVSVRYAPSAHGRHDATLRIKSNAGQFVVDLSGESVAPAQPAAPATTAPAPRVAAVASDAPALHAKRCTRDVRGERPEGRGERHPRPRHASPAAAASMPPPTPRPAAARCGSSSRRARAVKPGTYTLKLQIGAKRTTHTAIA